jgi:hypothetical protein
MYTDTNIIAVYILSYKVFVEVEQIMI